MINKQLYFIVLLLLISSTVTGQGFSYLEEEFIEEEDIRLEQSMYSVYMGLFNISISNEFRLGDFTSLKIEYKFYAGDIYAENFNLKKFGFLPSIIAESRWYYNRIKRGYLYKDLHNNAGNYFGFRVGYILGKSLLRNDFNESPSFYITPVYGLKRNFTTKSRFNYELGVGINIEYTPLDKYNHCDEIYESFYFRIGIGYRL